MNDENHSPTPWWPAFFDETYASFGLVDRDPERARRTVDFLFDVLQLQPGMRLFDQCCGIGRLSVPLAERGIHVVGVDQAAAYVERARADTRGLPAEFHCADAHAFVAPEPCDAAINWFTSVGYVEDDEANARIFERAHASLKPGGRYAVDYQNVPRVLREFRERFFQGPGPDDPEGVIVVEESAADFARGMIDSVWTFIHPDGRRDRRRVSTRLYMPHEIAGLLRRCGFERIELYGSVEGEPFGLNTARCITVARRPGIC
jgi:SAM-dependent methyltransferase